MLALPVAFGSLRLPLPAAIHSQSRGSSSDRRGQRLRHGFSVLQIAAAFLLLAGAGCPGLALRSALQIDPGSQASGVSVAELVLP